MGVIGDLYRNKTDIDFPKVFRPMLVVSTILVVASIVSLVWRGLNLSIEFEGGASWEVPSETLTLDQAESVLQGRGDREQLRAMVDERADELAVGVERAAAFITAQSGGPGINRVYVSGGGAGVHGLVEALGARLGVRAELADALSRLRVRPEVMESVPIDELAPMLMLPIGLALRKA